MHDMNIMYDDTEATTTRFVGYIGNVSRFDLAITETAHFFGKKLVHNLQSGRSAILSAEEADDADVLANAFALSRAEAEELGEFLSTIL